VPELELVPDSQVVPGKVSVVFPSRGRSATLLPKAFESLQRKASNPDLVEYGVAHDPDDPETGEVARAYGAFVYEAPERLGWAGNNTYFAKLFERSTGEWLVPWGDDGLMLTEGWDEIIRTSPRGVLYLHGGVADHNVFPAVHRDVLKAIGEHCPSPHQDTWLTEVAQEAGVLHDSGILILEDRFDVTGNNRDKTWEEGSIHAYRSSEYYAPAMAAHRSRHAAQVREALNVS
jgi:hypothetical protein